MIRIPFVFCLSWFCLLISWCQAHSFKVAIPPGDDVCFRVRIPNGKPSSSLTGLFEVEDDDVEGSEFSLFIVEGNKHTGEVVYQSPPDVLFGSISVPEAKSGTSYAICFKSHLDENDRDDKEEYITVGFSLRIHTERVRSLQEGEYGPDEQRALELVERAAEIHEDWSKFLDIMDFSHNREAVYEEMANTILYRLAKWTYIEAFVLIGMATGQVMYWKKFFENRRYLQIL